MIAAANSATRRASRRPISMIWPAPSPRTCRFSSPAISTSRRFSTGLPRPRTPRPRTFDLKVEYPASKRIVDAGMIDSFRAVRPDEVSDTAYTWTPGYPYPTLSSTEVHDRIDIIYHAGTGVTATSAIQRRSARWQSEYSLCRCRLQRRSSRRCRRLRYCQAAHHWIDLNNDCSLDAADWSMFRAGQFRDMTGLTPAQAYAMGDLNGDFRNDHADFLIFKHLV